MYIENNTALRRGRMSRNLPPLRPPVPVERLVPRRLLEEAEARAAQLEIELGWARREIALLQGIPYEPPAPESAPVAVPSPPEPIVAAPQSEPIPAPNKLQMIDIIHATCKHFGVTKAELTGPTKSYRIANARMIAVWIGCRHCGYSLKFVGRFFNRDHTTMINSRRKIDNLLKAGDPMTVGDVGELERQFGLSPVPIP